MFTDVAKVKVAAGKGGNGIVSFSRSRGNSKGGPDGGDGGDGGNVVARADHNTNTLSKYRTSKDWKAESGKDGASNKRKGKKGDNIELIVPPGTSIYDQGELIADLEKEGDEAIIAYGGRGGFGNAHFISSVRRAPKLAEIGEPGQERELTFELKLVADVGLVGLPNAGKSTLLSVISNARPKIANYPFTTLEPNLGVVDINKTSFLVADIPGLIEGASTGKGLGDDFLRHVERNKILIHLIDVNSQDIIEDYSIITKELKNYKVDLSGRAKVLVLSKIDGLQKEELDKKVSELSAYAKISKKDIYTISSVAKKGLLELKGAVSKKLQEVNKLEIVQKVSEELPVIRLDESKQWDVVKKASKFIVTGKEIEGFAKRTDMNQYQAVQRLRHILIKKGIMRQAAKLGAIEGESTIQIADRELTY